MNQQRAQGHSLAAQKKASQPTSQPDSLPESQPASQPASQKFARQPDSQPPLTVRQIKAEAEKNGAHKMITHKT